MAVHLDVVTRFDDRSVRSAASDLQRDLRREGQAAGQAWGDQFAGGVAKSMPKYERAMDKAVNAASRVVVAERKVTESRERHEASAKAVADAEKRLANVRKDASATSKQIIDAERDLDRVRERHSRTTTALVSAVENRNRTLRSERSAVRDLTNEYHRLLNGLPDASQGGRTAISSFSQLGTALGAVGRIGTPVAIVGLGAVLVDLAGVAASAAQSLWLIPAAGGAAAAAFGTLKLATSGFADAIKDIRDPKKFAEDLQSLSPNAQQAALAIQAMMPAFDQLKNATQDSLFAGVPQQLNQLTNTFLPAVQQLTTGIAGAFNQMFTGVANQLMTPETQAALQSFISNVVTAFQQLAPAAAPLTKALAEIMQVGSGFLPDLARAASDAARSFGDFITRAQQSGDLQRWLSEGLDTLKQLGQGAWMLLQAFMQLAPVGRDVLPDIVTLLGEVRDIMPVIASAAGAMGPQFRMWSDMIEAVKTQVGLLSKAIEGVGNVAVTIANVVKNALDIGFLTPLRMAIDLYNKLPLPDIPNIPKIPDIPHFSLGTPDQGPPVDIDLPSSLPGGSGPWAPWAPGGMPSLLPSAGLPLVPSGGYPVPPPPPASGSSSAPPPYFDPKLWQVPGASFSANSLPEGLASPYGLQPNAEQLNRIITAMFPQVQSIGGFRPDPGFPGEHGAGRALDIMVGGNKALGDAINQWILANAAALGVNYTLWQQAQHNPNGQVIPMADRGSPTENHMDHVHVNVRPGPATGIVPPAPAMAGFSSGGGYYQVDPQQVFDAQSQVLRAKHNLEQDRLRLRELEAKGNASQRELLTAKNQVAEDERALQSAQMKLAEAQQGTLKKQTSAANSFASGMGQIGAQLDQDFGLSKGLPGLAENLTKFLANLAFAPALGALSAVSAAAGGPQRTGSGLVGLIASSAGFGGAMIPTPSAMGPAPLGGGMGAPMGPVGAGLGLVPTPGPIGAVIPPTPTRGGPVGAPAPTAAVGAPGVGPDALNRFMAGGPLPLGGGGQAFGAGLPGAAPGYAGAQGSSVIGGQAPGVGAGGSGFSGLDGLPMSAAMTAAGSLNMLAPGAGIAAQIGIQEINRAIGYAGQAVGIGVSGLLETFLPHDSPLADTSNSWFGRLAAGFAGARPALPNRISMPAPKQPQPQGEQGGKRAGPEALVKIDTFNAGKQTPDEIGKELNWHAAQANQSPVLGR
ncbi:hypothetical protein [Segniliparus rotundus DSM 44985] [Mycobacterium shimoidei]|uniref:ARB-07466-like C-terminal domain-containing protein n=1 Tax=Mycobacterium shimoidei TaxID=29313 RepID=A0A375YXE5_MYCSH|nr:hypothetical protein [Mycobacterium shimoidei]SRX93558.1 hypothetical protein [Segniliparus rotundus DSM 44985] [Mycobacterium shimoidei]